MVAVEPDNSAALTTWTAHTDPTITRDAFCPQFIREAVEKEMDVKTEVFEDLRLKYAVFPCEIVDKTGEEMEPRTVVAKISTSAVDLDGEVLLPKGIVLDQYINNPVVYYGHDHSEPPVGKNLWIKAAGKNVVAKTQFANTVFGNDLHGLYQERIMRGFSVAFPMRDAEWHEPTEKEIVRNPAWAKAKRIYTKWTLMEYSAVGLPANPEALAMAVSKGICRPETAKRLGWTGKECGATIVVVHEPLVRPKRVVRRKRHVCRRGTIWAKRSDARQTIETSIARALGRV